MFVQLLLLVFTDLISCAQIFGVFPAPGYSQFILAEKLMIELANQGHEVTVVSPYQPKTNLNNYKTVSTDGLLELYRDLDMFQVESRNFVTSIMGSQRSGLTITEYTLSNEHVQQLIHSNASFDLVIVEQFFCEALMGFAKHFNAPLIIFSSIGPSEWSNSLMANPDLPSYMPLTKFTYTTKMTFSQRLKNSAAFLFDILYKRYVIYPKHDFLLKKYFPNPMDLKDVMYNASLMFLNSHYSISDPLPLVTGMIEIGGFHINPGGLPKHLQEFLDEAADGAIYFSMGTHLKSSNLNKNTLQDILTVFSKLKQRVLWKFDQSLSNLPGNVLISKWFPQAEILGHRNVKLFISHGGLLSTTESVYFGVPIIGIPVFGDQKMNIAKAERSGFAISIPYPELSEQTLFESIEAILKNPKYTKNVKIRSRLYHDQPIEPLNLAMYWINFVIRNKNSTLLKFSALELKWYQVYLLDVFGFCLLVVLVIAAAVRYCLRIVNRKLFKKLKIH